MSATSSYYRPPHESYNKHWDVYGVPSSSEIAKFEKEYDTLTGKGIWSEQELNEFAQLREDYLSGDKSPWQTEVALKYFRGDRNVREETQDILAEGGIGDYTPATSFIEAKQQADSAYVQYLKNAFDEDPDKAIGALIAKGAPRFNTKADYDLYNSLDEDSLHRKAMDAQAAVMKDYLNRNDISLETGVGINTGIMGQAPSPYLNTGTALGAEYADRDEFRVGDFGQYSMLGYDLPEQSDFEKAVGFGLDILTVFQPQYAPLTQGSKTLLQTGDLEEALKSAGGAYIATEIGNIGNAEITQVFDDLGIDLTALPQPVQDVVLDTTTAALEGKSGSEAFEEAVTGEALGYLGEGAEEALRAIDIDLPDFETPQIVKDVGDVIVDVLEPPLEFVGETFEPVIEAGEQVLSTAEDVLEPVKEVVETVGEPIVDVVDEIIDAVDSPLGDLLEGVISGIGGTGGMMAGTRKPTQVEDIFDKELFKFDTEIKSTQEMLSPMMNLRRYG